MWFWANFVINQCTCLKNEHRTQDCSDTSKSWEDSQKECDGLNWSEKHESNNQGMLIILLTTEWIGTPVIFYSMTVLPYDVSNYYTVVYLSVFLTFQRSFGSKHTLVTIYDYSEPNFPISSSTNVGLRINSKHFESVPEQFSVASRFSRTFCIEDHSFIYALL